MPRPTCALMVIAATALPGALAAKTLTQFDAFYVLGDSLSDTGNVFRATGGLIPPSGVIGPYFEGRFSNGPIWADVVADAYFQDKPASSFAWGSARAIENDDLFVDLPTQLGGLLGSVDPAEGDALVSLWFGGNDLFGAIGDGDAGAVAEAAAAAVGDAGRTLGAAGFDDLLIFNLPDLGGTPRYSVFEPDLVSQASDATQVFNDALAAQSQALRDAGLSVTEIDIAGLFDDLLGDPAAFGIGEAVQPCVVADDVFTLFSVCDDPDGFLFFDGVHPTSDVHRIVAGAVEAAFTPAPIPLPASAWLLLGGLGAIAAMRRRPN